MVSGRPDARAAMRLVWSIGSVLVLVQIGLVTLFVVAVRAGLDGDRPSWGLALTLLPGIVALGWVFSRLPARVRQIRSWSTPHGTSTLHGTGQQHGRQEQGAQAFAVPAVPAGGSSRPGRARARWPLTAVAGLAVVSLVPGWVQAAWTWDAWRIWQVGVLVVVAAGALLAWSAHLRWRSRSDVLARRTEQAEAPDDRG
ncbi:hypothetical protein [Kineococcus terrestris]|uniref:hypothetical protein n=1 Tax=Kineococcus terrestris TaxID=2044856 RepID=UPI0034DB6058